MKDKTTITVQRDTQKKLMMFKIETNAKSLDEVLMFMIDKLKEEKESDTQNNN